MIARLPERCLAPLLLALALNLSAVPASEPPRIGSPADLVFDIGQEEAIGRNIYFQLLESGEVLEDPVIDAYIQEVGERVALAAGIEDMDFTFFVIDDPGINAFALPGGYIGVNRGLMLATEGESELAGVLAHEVAHVTQRHIAQRVAQNRRTDLTTALLVIVGVIAASGSSDRDLVPGVISAGQAAGLQAKINYTRDMEYEADRVGIQYLASAGYEPDAMAGFFDVLGQRRRLIAPTGIPEYLSTHPVSSARIAEARARAENITEQIRPPNRLYDLSMARLLAISHPQPAALLEALGEVDSPVEPGTLGHRYAVALTLLRMGRTAEASRQLAELLDQNEDIIGFHVDLGQAQLADERPFQGLHTLRSASRLFPRNRAVTLAYADALLYALRPKDAHDLMLDYLNNAQRSRPSEIRVLARAAERAGRTSDKHLYMAEYHLMKGDARNAIDQLRLALAVPDLDRYRRSRYEARLEEIFRIIPPDVLEQIEDERRGRRPRDEDDRSQVG